jgi:hypothetical protein
MKMLAMQYLPPHPFSSRYEYLVASYRRSSVPNRFVRGLAAADSLQAVIADEWLGAGRVDGDQQQVFGRPELIACLRSVRP